MSEKSEIIEFGLSTGLSCEKGTKYIFFLLRRVPMLLRLAAKASLVDRNITTGLLLRR